MYDYFVEKKKEKKEKKLGRGRGWCNKKKSVLGGVDSYLRRWSRSVRRTTKNLEKDKPKNLEKTAKRGIYATLLLLLRFLTLLGRARTKACKLQNLQNCLS